MKIVYLITGSGGSFYCGNCYRDMLYIRAIRKVPGIDAKAVPLYLPPGQDNNEPGLKDKVFFGAISMYLREKVRIFRNMPPFLDRLLDTKLFLNLASRQAGTTRTDGLEELTLNMIKGDNAFRAYEVDRLARYLEKDGKPDVIHLSNALIIGLARQLKKRMKVRIVCSLLNEDDWIDEMAEPYRTEAWNLIAREAPNIDQFITPSNYYKALFIRNTGLSGENINVVPLGFDPADSSVQRDHDRKNAIGFFCRVNRMNGFDKIVDAFIDLKESGKQPDLRLHVCGGYTGDDKAFIAEQIKKIRTHGLEKSVRIFPDFQGAGKMEFFQSVDAISVPVRKYDGYGLYILEANSAGVPVVEPATGAFPEIIATTGGGIVYSPDTTGELASSLLKILSNDDLRKSLGEKGREKVLSEFSLARMATGLSSAYGKLQTDH
jgi:glycosyltransferase involved in cell wall biosynthesis